MSLKIITPPAEEPLTLQEVKLHLRIDTQDDDLLLTSLITVARQLAEVEIKGALISQEWEYGLDCFPSCLRLPLAPVVSVESIKYLDFTGAEQTLDVAAYVADTDSLPARISPAYGYIWPAVRSQFNSVRVRFVAGWADAASVPQNIKQWLLLKIGDLYENREAGSAVETGRFFDSLLDEYRRPF